LFIKHTKTGNPLVDSVAEHQPGSADAYFRYLHYPFYVAPVGFCVAVAHFFSDERSAAALFLPLYAAVAYYFANRMVRLIIFLGPIASSLTGIAVGYALDDIFATAHWQLAGAQRLEDGEEEDERDEQRDDERDKRDDKKKPSSAAARGRPGRGARRRKTSSTSLAGLLDANVARPLRAAWRSPSIRRGRAAVFVAAMLVLSRRLEGFWEYSHDMARGMSQPSVMFKGQLNDGRTVIVKDYVEAYHWLRDNTPEDARVMAWWDYGYQIAGVANRTTLADGNTWNHEHIALLGKCLVSPEEVGHPIVRQLADYVLVWTTRYAGMPGDDLAKSPHMARIAGSVYDDVKQEGFYVDERGNPSASMRESLLFKLSAAGMQPDVEAPERYEEAYASKNRMVRIWKVLDVDEETKRATNAGEHKVCDAGGWYCPGQYPEKLREVLSTKRDFQLEH
jgi:dolichyl-diphosphooligosaccharide--protein glycosyltransferase